MNDYTRRDATSFRDELFNRGMAGSSVSRTFTTVKAVFNFACAEWGLDARNPFAGVYFDRAKGVTQREPFSDDEIRQVQAACKETDDELRWILALLADTGARLAEIVGLAREDVELDHPDGPMLHIRPHPWRTLKTRSSQRSIPLVGSSLWAAQQATAETRGMHLFPRYTDDARCNANSASAALSKWLKNNLKAGRTVHSLRHSMRDRLRAVECPPDIVDQIGGWAPSGVGASYGRGYPLAVLREWMERTALGG
ncbi:site-specific integrase [Tranquillimonas alkanivorans]|uniref:site-specific integrase n=1 Tax=Tranquillimonas alkanivorans TaxID=441119 RepID=UPI001FE14D65|nr:tyrosine-type recombinase/integrase [Tranquillimonas alkanivorans]